MDNRIQPNSMIHDVVPESNSKKVVFGIFKDNEIISPDGEITPCVTYKSVREKIELREGFYHLTKYDGIKVWTIFQYILL